MKLISKKEYLNGVTAIYTNKGNYFLDNRDKSKTKGMFYNSYPGNWDAKPIKDVNLINTISCLMGTNPKTIYFSCFCGLTGNWKLLKGKSESNKKERYYMCKCGTAVPVSLLKKKGII